MREKTYQTNNFITQVVEANGYAIEYKTQEATVLGQIFYQTYNLLKVIKNLVTKD